MNHVTMEDLSPLAQEILNKGVHYILPCPSFIPKGYKSSGYKMYQNPEQLASLVQLMMDEEIKSYCEIGIKFGGTFRFICEKLHALDNNFEAVGIDIIDMSDVEEAMDEQGIHSAFIQKSSRRVNLMYNYDAIFIDGDHSYEGVKSDFERFKDKANKLVIFHDITNDECLGVVKLWKHLKDKYRSLEFTQYGRYGIGVLYIKEEVK